jgi:hypothetical protein
VALLGDNQGEYWNYLLGSALCGTNCGIKKVIDFGLMTFNSKVLNDSLLPDVVILNLVPTKI